MQRLWLRYGKALCAVSFVAAQLISPAAFAQTATSAPKQASPRSAEIKGETDRYGTKMLDAGDMPLNEVRRGMEGACWTVFEGDTVVPMPFVVKGVMENHLGPGRHLIMIRLSGEKAEFTGVASGMSGSPCRIQNRLMGALSYAFATFAKEPIAGVTPIEDMRAVLRLPKDALPWRRVANETHLKNDTDNGWVGAWRRFALGSKALEKSEQAGTAGAAKKAEAKIDQAQQLATPLGIVGAPPRVLAHFEPWLRAQGWSAHGGVAASASQSGSYHKSSTAEQRADIWQQRSKDKDLVPGGAVAAVWVQGDVSMVGTGTVTDVAEDEVLAFGHPFVSAGSFSVPMAQSFILNTMASQRRSFKMAVAGAVVGEFFQDRLPAIAGRLGSAPQMVPVQGVVHTSKGAQRFAFEVARDVKLTPRFISIGLASALAGRLEAGPRGLLNVSAVISADDLREPVRMQRRYTAARDDGLWLAPAMDTASMVAALWHTPWTAPPGLKIALEAHFQPEPIEEQVVQIHTDRAFGRPGDVVDVAVRLQRWRGLSPIVRFQLPLKRAWAGKKLALFAGGPGAAQALLQRAQGLPLPQSRQHVADWLASLPQVGHVFLIAGVASPGLAIDGAYLATLPPSLLALWSGAPRVGMGRQSVAWQAKQARKGVVVGAASASLDVAPF